MKYMVVAYDKNRGIGADNDLLWQRDLPADLKHFKQLTVGASIVMGRKTFESIGRPLPQRQNIVLSRQTLKLDGVTVVDSLQAAYEAAEHDAIAVIGGESVFTEALASVDTVYATEVQATFPAATVFFPELDDSWEEAARAPHKADERNRYDFDFVTYRKRKKV